MKLDSEQQRQQLLQVIGALPINGNLGQVTQEANILHGLVQAISGAGIDRSMTTKPGRPPKVVAPLSGPEPAMPTPEREN